MENTMTVCKNRNGTFKFKNIIKIICDGDNRICRNTIRRAYSIEDLEIMAASINEVEKSYL